jgi:hypothetical protein
MVCVSTDRTSAHQFNISRQFVRRGVKNVTRAPRSFVHAAFIIPRESYFIASRAIYIFGLSDMDWLCSRGVKRSLAPSRRAWTVCFRYLFTRGWPPVPLLAAFDVQLAQLYYFNSPPWLICLPPRFPLAMAIYFCAAESHHCSRAVCPH